MLVPVNTRNTEASDRPMRAQKAQNSIWAVAAEIAWMRNEKKNTKRAGQHDHPLQRRAEDRLVDGRRRRDQEGNQPGQHEPEPHVVVDPQHALAQALVEDSRPDQRCASSARQKVCSWFSPRV